MNKINVFGGTGFIGGRFSKKYPNIVILNERNDYIPKTNNILYFISTVDNYNIHKNLHIDIDTNLNVLMNVIGNIDKNSDTIINFVSSWFVYGQNEKIPFKEDDLSCNPTGFYSITKRCAEQLLISYCNTFGIKYRIFRLANVIGEGDIKISKKKNALQFLIKEVVNNKDIELYYGGEVLRDYIYVDDVCDAIYHCMNYSPENQIINIGNGKPYKLLDIINKSIIKSESTSKIININPTHFHNVVQVKNSYLDITKLDSYGFKCKYTIDDILDNLINYYKET